MPRLMLWRAAGLPCGLRSCRELLAIIRPAVDNAWVPKIALRAAPTSARMTFEKKALKEDSMHSIWFGEFMGTLVLILLGDGVNAAVTLRKSYAADSGWMVITTGWALGVLCRVVVAQAFGTPGANLNPAITLAADIISGNYSQLLVFWSAQLLGAM